MPISSSLLSAMTIEGIIMPEWALFLISLAIGAVLRVIYFLMRLLEKRTNIKPVTIVLDLVFCLVCFAAFIAASFLFAKTQFYFFMLCAMTAGFFLTAIFI